MLESTKIKPGSPVQFRSASDRYRRWGRSAWRLRARPLVSSPDQPLGGRRGPREGFDAPTRPPTRVPVWPCAEFRPFLGLTATPEAAYSYIEYNKLTDRAAN